MSLSGLVHSYMAWASCDFFISWRTSVCFFTSISWLAHSYHVWRGLLVYYCITSKRTSVWFLASEGLFFPDGCLPLTCIYRITYIMHVVPARHAKKKPTTITTRRSPEHEASTPFQPRWWGSDQATRRGGVVVVYGSVGSGFLSW